MSRHLKPRHDVSGREHHNPEMVGREDYLNNRSMDFDRYPHDCIAQDIYEVGYRDECVEHMEAPQRFIKGV